VRVYAFFFLHNNIEDESASNGSLEQSKKQLSFIAQTNNKLMITPEQDPKTASRAKRR
jgi:hypothetical protein